MGHYLDLGPTTRLVDHIEFDVLSGTIGQVQADRQPSILGGGCAHGLLQHFVIIHAETGCLLVAAIISIIVIIVVFDIVRRSGCFALALTFDGFA